MTGTAARAAAAAEGGRALDIEISRHVFGHDIKPEWESWLPGIPPYSTDIAVAWLVVERLREIGLQLVIATEGDGWEVEVCTTKALSRQGYAGCYHEDRSLPFAICRAALRSVAALAARAEGDGA